MTAEPTHVEDPNRPLDVFASYGALAVGVSGLVLAALAVLVP